MAHTGWFFVAYGMGLIYLLFHSESVRSVRDLRRAWFFFVLALFAIPLFTGLRAGFWDEKELVLVEFWSVGVSWTCVALSALFLPAALTDSVDRLPPPKDSPPRSHRSLRSSRKRRRREKEEDEGEEGEEHEG